MKKRFTAIQRNNDKTMLALIRKEKNGYRPRILRDALRNSRLRLEHTGKIIWRAPKIGLGAYFINNKKT